MAYQKAVSNYNNNISKEDEDDAIPYSSVDYDKGKFTRRRNITYQIKSTTSENIPHSTPPPSTTTPNLNFPSGRIRIIYCSRTHSQLDQIIHELSKCSPYYLDDLLVTPIGSKKYLCSNLELKDLLEKKKYNSSLSSSIYNSEDNECLTILSDRIKKLNLSDEKESEESKSNINRKRSNNEDYSFDSIKLNYHKTRKRRKSGVGASDHVKEESEEGIETEDNAKEISIDEACSQARDCSSCPYYTQDVNAFKKQQEAIVNRSKSLEVIERFKNNKRSPQDVVSTLSEVPFTLRLTNNLKAKHFSPYQYKTLSFVKKLIYNSRPIYNNGNKKEKEKVKTEKKIRDVEDLIDLSQKTKACAYYSLRESLSISDVILAPYNYILDPIIRQRFKINLSGGQLTSNDEHIMKLNLKEEKRKEKEKKKKEREKENGYTEEEEYNQDESEIHQETPKDTTFINDILIFDEGHHIEDRAREVASIKLSILNIHQLIYELCLCALPIYNQENVDIQSRNEDEINKPLIQPTIISKIVDILLDIVNFIFDMSSTISFSQTSTTSGFSSKSSVNNWNNNCIWEGEEFLNNFERFTNKSLGGLNQLPLIFKTFKELLKESENPVETEENEMQVEDDDQNDENFFNINNNRGSIHESSNSNNKKRNNVPITLASLYFLENIVNVFQFLMNEVKNKRKTYNVYIERNAGNSSGHSGGNNANIAAINANNNFYPLNLFYLNNMNKKFNLFKTHFFCNENLPTNNYYNNYYSSTLDTSSYSILEEMDNPSSLFELNKLNYQILTTLSVQKNSKVNDLKFLTLHIVCLEASVILLPLSLSVRSLVLASGTLSPIDGLAQECGFGKEYSINNEDIESLKDPNANEDNTDNKIPTLKPPISDITNTLEPYSEESKKVIKTYFKNYYSLEASHNLVDIKRQIFVRQGGTLYLKNSIEINSISPIVMNLSHELLKNESKFYLNYPNMLTSDETDQVIEENNRKLPFNNIFNCNYKSQQESDFFINLTLVFLNYFLHTPGGFLMFLPSYNLIYKLNEYWEKTFVQIDENNNLIYSDSNLRQKSRYYKGGTKIKRISLSKYIEIISDGKIYFEPKDNNNNQFKDLLEDFILNIDPNSSSTSLKKTVGKKRKSKRKVIRAVFVGVYRGKLSEGSDFSDKLTRTILLVGIPYPNPGDTFIQLKKKYQDSLVINFRRIEREKLTSKDNNSSIQTKNLLPLSGEEWYKQCAYRALNQAIGRGIRHSKDYSAIILLDSRHILDNVNQNRVSPYLSKWLRPFIKNTESLFNKDLEEFKIFFKYLENSTFYNKNLIIKEPIEEIDIAEHEESNDGLELIDDENIIENESKLSDDKNQRKKGTLISFFLTKNKDANNNITDESNKNNKTNNNKNNLSRNENLNNKLSISNSNNMMNNNVDNIKYNKTKITELSNLNVNNIELKENFKIDIDAPIDFDGDSNQVEEEFQPEVYFDFQGDNQLKNISEMKTLDFTENNDHVFSEIKKKDIEENLIQKDAELIDFNHLDPSVLSRNNKESTQSNFSQLSDLELFQIKSRSEVSKLNKSLEDISDNELLRLSEKIENDVEEIDNYKISNSPCIELDDTDLLGVEINVKGDLSTQLSDNDLLNFVLSQKSVDISKDLSDRDLLNFINEHDKIDKFNDNLQDLNDSDLLRLGNISQFNISKEICDHDLLDLVYESQNFSQNSSTMGSQNKKLDTFFSSSN